MKYFKPSFLITLGIITAISIGYLTWLATPIVFTFGVEKYEDYQIYQEQQHKPKFDPNAPQFTIEDAPAPVYPAPLYLDEKGNDIPGHKFKIVGDRGREEQYSDDCIHWYISSQPYFDLPKNVTAVDKSVEGKGTPSPNNGCIPPGYSTAVK